MTAAESAAATVGVSFSALARRQAHPCSTAQPRQTVPPSRQPVSPPAAQQSSAQQALDVSVAQVYSRTSLDAASSGVVAGGDVSQGSAGNCGADGNQPVDLDQVGLRSQTSCRLALDVSSEWFWACCILLPATGSPSVVLLKFVMKQNKIKQQALLMMNSVLLVFTPFWEKPRN